MFDTGLPAHRATVLAELTAALGDRELALWISRLVEPDSVGNVLAVLERLRVRRILNATQTNQLRLVTSRWEEFSAASGYSVERLQFGDVLEIGERRLEVVRPAARVIATSWLFDRDSRILFSSDFFGHLHRASREAGLVASAGEDLLPVEAVEAHLLAKYEWLQGADVGPICEALASIFERLPVETIAPGHGCVIAGAEAARAHCRLTLEALRRLGGEPARAGS